jgi:hypothetical protein
LYANEKKVQCKENQFSSNICPPPALHDTFYLFGFPFYSKTVAGGNIVFHSALQIKHFM